MTEIHKHGNCTCDSGTDKCGCDASGCGTDKCSCDRDEHIHHANESECGCGLGCHSHDESDHKKTLIRIIISAFLLVAVSLVHAQETAKFLLYMIPYIIIGYDILKNAVKGIARCLPFDENFLMAIATIGAIILGEYAEAVAVMLFYQAGELFQSYAVGKSRKNIRELMDIRPDYANAEDKDGRLAKVSPDRVEIGSIIVVKPGERVPIDGVVINGASSVNASALTGESMPIDIGVGDEVISGSINLSGLIKIKTTKAFGESTVSKILELVEDASSKKSKSEKFISKFAYVYTPVVCGFALLLAVIPPVIRMAIGLGGEWGEWIYRALTFLVISCPCALVISIPLSFFAGIGGASKAGVLIKGSNYIETLSKAKCVMFDKTGTLTNGAFKVAGVYHNKISYDKVLYYAALSESYSDHPISRSIKNVFSGELDGGKVSGIKEIAGYGVTCTVGGKAVAVGNGKLMRELGIRYKKCRQAGTAVHVAIDGQYEGYIRICDTIKADAKKGVLLLKKMGIKDTVMLTGDSEASAKAVADKVGIDRFYHSLLPSDKVGVVEKYLEGMKNGEKLAFVGDGINDAPALSRADIGIAMGAKGFDAAIEAADIVLMDDSVAKLPLAIGISRKCMKIVYENIYFSIGIKLICLVLGALGIANMWMAVFADVGVMIIAVLNAVRCLYTKRLGGAR